MFINFFQKRQYLDARASASFKEWQLVKNRQRKTKEQQSLEECRQKVSPDKFMYVTVRTSTYTMGNHVEINYDFSVCHF